MSSETCMKAVNYDPQNIFWWNKCICSIDKHICCHEKFGITWISQIELCTEFSLKSVTRVGKFVRFGRNGHTKHQAFYRKNVNMDKIAGKLMLLLWTILPFENTESASMGLTICMKEINYKTFCSPGYCSSNMIKYCNH